MGQLHENNLQLTHHLKVNSCEGYWGKTFPYAVGKVGSEITKDASVLKFLGTGL